MGVGGQASRRAVPAPAVAPATASLHRSIEAITRLREVSPHITPTVLARDRLLDVVPSLSQLLPHGLARGTTVGVSGGGALSLGLRVVAGAVQAGSWLAVVGCDDLCLAAVEQAGVPLHRTVVIDQPPRSSWGSVMAALVDVFDVVVVSGTHRARVRDCRRLASRARERGSVIVDTGGVWPEAPDIEMNVVGQQWWGLGAGHGVLVAREVTVELRGRRGVRPTCVTFMLDGDEAPTGLLECVSRGSVSGTHPPEPVPLVAAG